MGTPAGQHLLLGTCELDFEEMAQYVESFNDARAFLTNGTWGLSELDHTDLVFLKFGTLGPEENSENRLNIHWSIIRLAIKHDSNGCLKGIFSHTHLADWDCFFLPFGNSLVKHKMRLRFSIAGVEYWRVSSSFLGLTQYIMVVGVLGGESHICFFGNWDFRRFWEEWGIT